MDGETTKELSAACTLDIFLEADLTRPLLPEMLMGDASPVGGVPITGVPTEEDLEKGWR